MAREKRFPKLSAEQAHAALRWLHALVKVTRRRTFKTGSATATDSSTRSRIGSSSSAERDRPICAGRGRWSVLRQGGDGVGLPQRLKLPGGKARGRYLDAVRRLTAANRSEVKAIKEKGGLKAAIREAKKLAE